ncbi:unnamed protein product [Rotaria sordida]|uniref:EF-hand domain-containing protein n=2 Tax=Rotaria sordida TaxID=392033 RepID=A0A818RR51_9BILA|nr:unnamed protein product [Rotaria sordida]
MIGKTINIYGRNFLINDCDLFTKTFYTKNFGVNSLQNCLCLQPERLEKDYIKLMENDYRILRYEAVLDSPRGDDKLRKFITSYRLSYDTISIHELPQRHTDSSFEHPQFYSPDDFYIGATIEAFHQQDRPDARLSKNIHVPRKPGDFICLYAEIRNKLQYMLITNPEEIRQMFLRYDKARNGYIAGENIFDIFRQINIPLDDDLIDAIKIIN